MAWNKQGNKEYRSKVYKANRAYVVRRDMGLCFRCEYLFGRLVPFDACDHFIPLSRGGTHDIGNLWLLCAVCHNEKTMLESNGKPYAFYPAVDPETGFDYDETNWLQVIEERNRRHK